MAVATCWYNDCTLTPEEAADPDKIDGEIVCRECYDGWRCENESPCPFCEDYWLEDELSDCFILVDDEYGEPGLYRPTRYPFYTLSLLSGGWFAEDAIERIGSLLDGQFDADGYPAAFVCKQCMGEEVK